MKTVYQVYIQYNEISPLKKALKDDKNIDVNVGRPVRKPDNPTEKVEIKVIVDKMQGRLHKEQISKLISEFGSIVHNSDITNPPITDEIKTYFVRNWITLVGGGIGIMLEEILRNWHEITNRNFDPYPSLAYSSIVIIAIGLSLLKK